MKYGVRVYAEEMKKLFQYRLLYTNKFWDVYWTYCNIFWRRTFGMLNFESKVLLLCAF